MIEVREWLELARRDLASGHHLLTGDFPEYAGRSAYLAAFHAARAFIGSRTDKVPKTHAGTRSEFARLVREEKRVSHHYVAFLSRSYEMKTHADYLGEQPVTREAAIAALRTAAELVALVESLV